MKKCSWKPNTEHLAVFAKIEPFIAEVREVFGEADYLIQLERLVQKFQTSKNCWKKDANC